MKGELPVLIADDGVGGAKLVARRAPVARCATVVSQRKLARVLGVIHEALADAAPCPEVVHVARLRGDAGHGSGGISEGMCSEGSGLLRSTEGAAAKGAEATCVG